MDPIEFAQESIARLGFAVVPFLREPVVGEHFTCLWTIEMPQPFTVVRTAEMHEVESQVSLFRQLVGREPATMPDECPYWAVMTTD